MLALALGVGSLGQRPAATNEDRMFAIAESMQCPICSGESVAQSNVEITKNIRTEIATQIRDGRTDAEISAFLITQYPAYQMTPPSDGAAGLVWSLPVVALVVSLGGLAVAFRRWQVPADHRATADDRDLVRRAQAGARDADIPPESTEDGLQ